MFGQAKPIWNGEALWLSDKLHLDLQMLHIINKENELCIVNKNSVGLWIENTFFKVSVSLKTLHTIYLWCLLLPSTSECKKKKCLFYFQMGGAKMSYSLAFWEVWGFKDQNGCLKLCRYLNADFSLYNSWMLPQMGPGRTFFWGSHIKPSAESFPGNASYTLPLYIGSKKLGIRNINLDTGIFLIGSLHGNESNTMLSPCQTTDLWIYRN